MATFSDIETQHILHLNTNQEDKSLQLFGEIKTSTDSKVPKKIQLLVASKKLPLMPIDNFISEVLPSSKLVEVLVENDHKKNFMSLTHSVDNDSKRMFKWPNNFSTTYTGNLAGKSRITESVKDQGGNVDADLRFSIMWSEGDSRDCCDLDAHCNISTTPSSQIRTIYYSNKTHSATKGFLDIDITQPLLFKKHNPTKSVVENIAFPSLALLPEGSTYQFKVRNYSGNNSEGFKTEDIYYMLD